MLLNSPIITGDVSGGLHSTSVDKLKGQPVAAMAPTTGQTLIWNGTAWTPATPSNGGGGGANGLTYYLRQDVDADAPTTNLPGPPKQLGRTGAVAQSTVTSGTLTTGVWTLLGGYVSESVPLDPNITSIPGGLWDFNVWAFGSANTSAPTVIRAKVFTYDGSNAPTLISTSGEQIINNVSAQFSLSSLVPQTAVTSTTRIYVSIEVKSSQNNHTATLQFGDGTPSHVHTSLPLVGGTGLWKNVAGVLQSPASLLVDADVDAAAAIAQSKISGLTTDLAAKAAKADLQIFTSSGTWTKPVGAKVVVVQLIGGGGGGGSGRKGASGTICGGGGGGGGAAYCERTVSADLLGSTVAVVVGTGGAGGPAQTIASTNGLNGSAGNNSTFGTWIFSGGGAGGIGGTTSGGTAGVGSTKGMFAGGAGGAGGTITAAGAGGSCQAGGAGGGGGGGVSSTPAFFAGGLGRVSFGSFINPSDALGGSSDGAPGSAGASVDANYAQGGNGGGGGAGSINAANNGGTGANGGFYGGGAGGGGAALDTNARSGAGGAGGAGIVIVTTYF